MGLSYIYTYAKSQLPEYEFHILDAHGTLYDNAYRGMEHNWERLMNSISNINPTIIGIGAYYFKSSKIFHETCRRIKAEYPHVTIIAGGNYPSDAPEKVLEDYNVDFIILNEGEFVFVEFLKEFFGEQKFDHLGGFISRGDNKEICKIHVLIDKHFKNTLDLYLVTTRLVIIGLCKYSWIQN